jgi:hypothetical protein
MTFSSDREDVKNDKVKKLNLNHKMGSVGEIKKKKNVGGRRGMRRDMNKARRRGTQKWVNNRKKKKNNKSLVNIFSN